MAEINPESSANLSATYDSPSGHQVFEHPIPTQQIKDGSVDVQTKTKYLSDLRASSKQLQDEINKFLTEKMEEDNKATGGVGNGALKQKSKDELEEENYGEENADDET